MPFESIDDRLKRYKHAERERQLKIEKFVEAYRMSFPMRDKWFIRGDGAFSEDKTRLRWDPTAVTGLEGFVSNLQSLLMPNFQQWARFVAGPQFDGATKQTIDAMLVEPSNILFNALDSSNLMLEANVSFKDMGIAVGLLQIHSTGDSERPLRFQAIPVHTVAFGEYQGEIKDVYRKFKVKAREIKSYWPDANIPSDLQSEISGNPGGEIEMLEGTIYYPNNPKESRYLYFVTELRTKKDIVLRPQKMSRWIPFRFAVSPGEVWGEGPILQILDIIRITNKIVELDVINAGMKISRPLMVDGSRVINPNNIRMEAGAIFHVQNMQNGQLPIVPLDPMGDFKFDQVTLKGYQDQIRNALFSDPMGPSEGPTTSATEVSIRQQNWIKRSAASMGRLANELLRPIILKSAVLLQDQGLMPASFEIDPSTFHIKVDGKQVSVDFLSPLATLEDEQKVQEFSQFNQELQAIMGPQLSMGVLNIPEIPQYLADKMNIDPNLVKGSPEIAQIQQQAQQAMQQQQMQQQQAPPTQNASAEAAPQEQQLPQLNMGQ